MASFSVRRKTPPLRLTSRVSAVCLNVAPLLVTHDASTGRQRVTRSLWRRPSEMVVITYFTKLPNFRLACKSRGKPACETSFVVPSNNVSRALGAALQAGEVLPFSRAWPFESSPMRGISGKLIGVRDVLPLIIQRDGTGYCGPNDCEQRYFHGRKNVKRRLAGAHHPRPPLLNSLSVCGGC